MFYSLVSRFDNNVIFQIFQYRIDKVSRQCREIYSILYKSPKFYVSWDCFILFFSLPLSLSHHIIIYAVVTKQKIHFFGAMWSRVREWMSQSERGSERIKTCKSISSTAVLPYNICMCIQCGNTVWGKNLRPPDGACACVRSRGRSRPRPQSRVVTPQYLSGVLVFTICVHSHFPLSLLSLSHHFSLYLSHTCTPYHALFFSLIY